MKFWKRSLSFLLAAALCISAGTGAVAATETETAETTEAIETGAIETDPLSEETEPFVTEDAASAVGMETEESASCDVQDSEPAEETADVPETGDTSSESVTMDDIIPNVEVAEIISDELDDGLVEDTVELSQEELSDVDDADPAKLESEASQSLNITPVLHTLFINYTLADANMTADGLTIDEMWAEHPEAFIAGYSSIAQLYAVDGNEDCFVAFLDVSRMNEAGTVLDAIFASKDIFDPDVLNDVCSYDAETGVVYVPKSLFIDSEGNEFDYDIQAQLLVAYDWKNEMTDIAVTTENHRTDVDAVAEVQTITEPSLDVTITIPLVTPETAENLDLEKVYVYVNDCIIPQQFYDTGYYFDTETGELSLNLAPVAIYSVKVVIEDDTLSETLIDSFTTETNASMNYIDANDVDGIACSPFSVSIDDKVAVGDVFKLTNSVPMTYIGEYLPNSTNETYRHDAECALNTYKYCYFSSQNSLSDDYYYMASRGADYFQTLLNQNNAIGYYDTSSDIYKYLVLNGLLFMVDTPTGLIKADGSDGTIDFTGMAAYSDRFVLHCIHVTKSATTETKTHVDSDDFDALGTANSTDNGEGGYVTNGTLWMRVVYVNRPSGYIIVSFLTQQTDTQNGSGLYKLKIEQSTTTFTLQKSSNNTVTVTSISSSSAYSLEGAVYGVYSDSGCNTQVTTMTTSSTGMSSIQITSGTYYLQEISSSPGYMINSEIATLNLTSGDAVTFTTRETTKTVTFRLGKQSANTSISDGNSAYSLAGAEYTVYQGTRFSSATAVATYTTDSNGTFTTGAFGLPSSGTYYFIKETSAPSGFDLDPTVWKIEVTDVNGTNNLTYKIYSGTSDSDFQLQSQATVTGGSTISITSTEPVKTVDIDVEKVSENTEFTDGNDCYSLEGAEYTLSKTNFGSWNTSRAETVMGVLYRASGRTQIATYTTDEQGLFTIDTLPLTVKEDGKSGFIYFLEETKASPGYELDRTIWAIMPYVSDRAIASARTSFSSKTTIVYDLYKSTNGGSTFTLVSAYLAIGSDGSIPITFAEPPANDPVGIVLTKISADGNVYAPTLEGAQFTVKFYAGVEPGETLPSEPTRTWVIETKAMTENGEVIYKASLDEDHKVSGDDFYYDSDGNICVPLGAITVEETKPAWGYTAEGGYLNDDTGNSVSADGGVIRLDVTQEMSGGAGELSGGNYYTKEEVPQYCSVTLYKKGGDGSALAGAEFTLEIKNPETGEYDVLTTGTSDANGKVVFDELVFGDYRIVETETINGYNLLKEPIEITLPYSSEDGYTDSDPTFSQDGYDYYCDVTFTIYNDSIPSLPMAGADGISVIPVLGASILAAAAFLFLMSRRRRAF